MITRFAPSPTGLLHLGHAYSAILNHDLARAAGGRFVLRIEDIDHTRCRPEFEAAILDDLRWLGLSWDGSVLRQSERMEVYETRLGALRARGLLYRCFRTRAEVAEAAGAPHGPVPRFEGAPLPADEEEDALSEGRPFAWRLSMRRALAEAGPLSYEEQDEDGRSRTVAADPSVHGDTVLARKDLGTSYHLASVTDDMESGVSHVVRGKDLADAASLHVLLYALLGEAPPAYRHHRLVLGEDGKRLAKRDRSATLQAMREAGETPEGVRARLGL